MKNLQTNSSLSGRKKLGNFLQNLRKEKNISITELSKVSNINVADIYRIEKGEKMKINPFYLKILAKIFNQDYKVFYRMIEFLENEESFSKEELINSLSKYYPELDINLLFIKLNNISKPQDKDMINVFIQNL